MSEIDNQIATLEFFNEKVKELLELSFIKASLYPKVGFSLKGNAGVMVNLRLRLKQQDHQTKQ